MGALTSKPFSFAARSWELLDRLAFDCTDTFFSSIKISFRGKSIIRVLPDFNSNLLSEWISDRARFSYDSYQNDSEFDKVIGFQFSLFSQTFLHFFFKRFSNNSYFFDFVSAQQNKAITAFSGFVPKVSQKLNYLNFDFRNSYFFDFNEILKKPAFKNYFMFGVNFRYQLPVFAVNFRKLANSPEIFFFNFGFFTNNLLGDINFGSSVKVFQNTIRGKSKLSRIYFSTDSVSFVNPFLHSLVFSGRKSHIYSFFDNPKYLISAETFSLLSGNSSLISFYIPHFFLSNQIFPRNDSLQKFDSPVVTSSNFYDFYFFFKKFANFNLSAVTFFNFNQSVYFYNNFYSHFSDFNQSGSSLNVLLALKRQSNSRSSFKYYS